MKTTTYTVYFIIHCNGEIYSALLCTFLGSVGVLFYCLSFHKNSGSLQLHHDIVTFLKSFIKFLDNINEFYVEK